MLSEKFNSRVPSALRDNRNWIRILCRALQFYSTQSLLHMWLAPSLLSIGVALLWDPQKTHFACSIYLLHTYLVLNIAKHYVCIFFAWNTVKNANFIPLLNTMGVLTCSICFNENTTQKIYLGKSNVGSR